MNDGTIVVGDRFEEFLANRGTVAASELLARLQAGEVDGTPVVVGQGLPDDQLAELRSGLPDGTVPERVARHWTHKRDPKNVMVGPPRRAGADHFVADLLVDARNEVLEDHLTGQHIPAIALMEAARQMWTAVTEQHLRPAADPTRFVVLSVSGRFERYVFPLPATLHLELLAREDGPAGETFRTSTTVRQTGAVAAEIRSEYRVVPEALSAKQESLAARQAVRTCLASAPAPATAGS